MRTATVFGTMTMMLLTWVGCAERTEQAPLAGRLVDLTHDFDANTVYWPTASEFELEVVAHGMTDRGFWYEANNFTAAEHGGTHIDAPVHFYEGRNSVDEIALEQLIGPGVMIDLREVCARDRDHLIGVADLEDWEQRHGTIPSGAIVLLDTGFARYWPDRARYMGTAARGAEAVADLHFPGLDPEAARWLVSERAIRAVGLDTPSIDYGQSVDFASHVTLFERNVPAFENVANLDELPATGFTVVALPMKIRGGSGGPLRIIAVLP